MDSGFEKEVLTRLTVIETKIDDYKILKEKVEVHITYQKIMKRILEEY